ncbi:MAG TPA: heterodisulfide reductase-related iron-sulfur binding cluster [Bacteroidales bacterium]|nr:heterodisulfide reductase-related iron-sulfur binding cluster [Bacteroidales bacterium]
MIEDGKKQLWAQYQKEIADDKYYYARSCIRQNFFPGAEEIFLKVLRQNLNKDIYDDARQTTCTGIGYHSAIVPLETTMTVVARQFSLMNELGYENFVCSCVTSFGIYSEMLETWHEFPETLEKTKENLYKATGRTFKLPKNLVHASDVIYKLRMDILPQLKYKLVNAKTGKPLNVVEHIGCHYAKIFPHKGVGGAEYPYVLAGLVDAWGGKLVDYPERRHCCGFGFRQYLVKANRGYSYSHSLKKFESMQPYDVDLIITNCPGCNYFLDRWQYVAAESEHKLYGVDGKAIPVLTFEEITALLLGYNPWEIGLQMHQIPVEPLLDKLGISYSKEDKYLNTKGPEIPELLNY